METNELQPGRGESASSTEQEGIFVIREVKRVISWSVRPSAKLMHKCWGVFFERSTVSSRRLRRLRYPLHSCRSCWLASPDVAWPSQPPFQLSRHLACFSWLSYRGTVGGNCGAAPTRRIVAIADGFAAILVGQVRAVA